MAYLAVVGSKAVNGVAAIHSEIIKETIFKVRLTQACMHCLPCHDFKALKALHVCCKVCGSEVVWNDVHLGHAANRISMSWHPASSRTRQTV
jgi:Zn finger protein HypA/HybF involved in hydrogenase expression